MAVFSHVLSSSNPRDPFGALGSALADLRTATGFVLIDLPYSPLGNSYVSPFAHYFPLPGRIY